MTTQRRQQWWAASFRPLRRKSFLLVWCAGLISMSGDWALKIALPMLVLESTGSVAATSGVAIAGVLPTLFFGGVAGVFVDRWDRRRVMLVASLGQALAVLPLAVIDGPDTVWVCYAVTFAVGTLAQFVQPAESALLPLLVDAKDLIAANSLNAVNNNLARLVGPALGGLVAAWAGLTAVAYVDAATFVVAALLLACVRGTYAAAGMDRLAGDVATETPSDRRFLRSYARIGTELVDGVAFIARSRVLVVLIATFTVTSVGEGLMGALFAVYVKEGLHGGVTEVGWLMSAQAVGGIVGGVVAGWFTRFSPIRLLTVGAAVFGVIDVVLFAYPLAWSAFWPAMVLLIMVGVPAVLVSSTVTAQIQGAAPDEFRGRVFAVMGTSMGLAMMLGAALGGAFGDDLGAMAMLIWQGAGYLVAGPVVGLLLGGRALAKARRTAAAVPAAVGASMAGPITERSITETSIGEPSNAGPSINGDSIRR
ncbi:MFS transporter [Actinopolymorpha sp. B9G3]|uniref:MFS transporter n=1 Tax=Actinopolymorpha sp. B9G3 TaxID=3158970 RepID=UPI0032D961AD